MSTVFLKFFNFFKNFINKHKNLPKNIQHAIIYYMFNWFKGKQNLVASDVKNGMLTSNFVSFKVGDKLVVPENTICYIRYKDKTYKELPAGDYSLNKEFLLDLYTKQLKGKTKIKNLKADLYFVNLNNFNFEFEYIDKLPLNKVKEKILFNVKMSVQVEDSKLFSKTLIYENTAPTAETTKNLIINYAENFIRFYFLKQKLSSTSINLEQQKEINNILASKFKKIGVSVNKTEVAIFKKTSKTSTKEDVNKTTIFNKELNIDNENSTQIEENSTKSIDLIDKKDYTTNTNLNLCPNCNNKLIKGSIFCHRCGYKK